MKGTLHLILGTPDSGRRSILSHANNPESPEAESHFLLPEELKDHTLPHTCWRWEEKEFRFSGSEPASPAEFFLFFSNNFDLADQFEASLSLLSSETELELGRIIVFLNSRLLVQADSSITEWIDGAAHFADALCFTHRENDNASEIAKCKERFESMRYPLETYAAKRRPLHWRESFPPPLGAFPTPLILRTCLNRKTPLKTILILLVSPMGKGRGPSLVLSPLDKIFLDPMPCFAFFCTLPSAGVAELVDALDSGSSVRKDVRVRVSPSAPPHEREKEPRL